MRLWPGRKRAAEPEAPGAEAAPPLVALSALERQTEALLWQEVLQARAALVAREAGFNAYWELLRGKHGLPREFGYDRDRGEVLAKNGKEAPDGRRDG